MIFCGKSGNFLPCSLTLYVNLKCTDLVKTASGVQHGSYSCSYQILDKKQLLGRKIYFGSPCGRYSFPYRGDVFHSCGRINLPEKGVISPLSSFPHLLFSSGI